jgi:2'-5' RNA ligase
MNRLFIALNIPEEIKQKIIEMRRNLINQIPGNQYERLRWEPKEKFHLTLKFIGDVNDLLADEIPNHLDFIEEYKKVNCELTKFGFFYNKRVLKILWVGFKVDELLNKLVEELNKKLLAVSGGSIPLDTREFRVHITLLRIKTNLGKDFITGFEQFIIPETKFIAENISLFKSELLPEMSKYVEIKKYNLK